MAQLNKSKIAASLKKQNISDKEVEKLNEYSVNKKNLGKVSGQIAVKKRIARLFSGKSLHKIDKELRKEGVFGSKKRRSFMDKLDSSKTTMSKHELAQRKRTLIKKKTGILARRKMADAADEEAMKAKALERAKTINNAGGKKKVGFEQLGVQKQGGGGFALGSGSADDYPDARDTHSVSGNDDLGGKDAIGLTGGSSLTDGAPDDYAGGGGMNFAA